MVYVGSSLHCSSHLVKFHQIPYQVYRRIGTICYSGVTFIEISIKRQQTNHCGINLYTQFTGRFKMLGLQNHKIKAFPTNANNYSFCKI